MPRTDRIDIMVLDLLMWRRKRLVCERSIASDASIVIEQQSTRFVRICKVGNVKKLNFR